MYKIPSVCVTVRLWDLDTHTNKVCYTGHNAPVWDMDIR